MQQYKNWDNLPAAGEFQPLPADGYVLSIINAKEEMSKRTKSPMLVIAFDIADGRYRGYYRNLYNNRKNDQGKWLGVYYITLPLDDGSESDNRKMSRLKGFINAVAESNDTYNAKRYFDIAQLKGKFVGGVFRREQYENKNGELKWSTKLAWTTSVDKIRIGEFTVPEDKYLQQDPPSYFPPQQQDGFTPIDDEIEGDEDLPF